MKQGPDFAAAVESECQAMRIEQELAALRNASGRISRRRTVVKKAKTPGRNTAKASS
jgi:hypothetical protein